MKTSNTLYLVIPCFNEQEVLPETSRRLLNKMQTLIMNNTISKKSRILFVDDGSTDRTWKLILEMHENNNLFSGLKLSRNRGHQNALLAGLLTVKDLSDVTISLDADLQDDPDSIDQFLTSFFSGNDIVYGVRKDRSSDTTVKRGTARLFYKLMNFMKVESVFNHADCRLLSKRALSALSDFKEVNLFLRGMVPLIGFNSDIVTYNRVARFAGQSKYPFKKMLQLAANGITSFSVAPIRFILFIGIFIFSISLLSILFLAVIAAIGISFNSIFWLLTSIWLACGIITASIGIVGEYVGKAFEEVKARPRYIIEEFLNY